MVKMRERFNPMLLVAAAIILVGIVAGLILNNAAGDLARLVFLLIGGVFLGIGLFRRRRASRTP
jgi:hypothetical protein